MKVASHSGSELLLESSPSTRAAQLGTPSSGCGSGTATLASPTTGTDALSVQSGRLQLVLRSCGTAKGMRRGSATAGTGTRVSPRLTSLLFLLGEELYRQPWAVYKCWAGGYVPVTLQRQVPAVLRASWPTWTRRTVAVVFTRRVLLVTLHLVLCSLFRAWTRSLTSLPGPPETLQLLYIDKVVDVLVVPVQLSSAVVKETAELPQLQFLVVWTMSLTCPLACWEHCGFSAVAAHRQGLGAEVW